jgi:hypothetical protein
MWYAAARFANKIAENSDGGIPESIALVYIIAASRYWPSAYSLPPAILYLLALSWSSAAEAGVGAALKAGA